MKSLKDYLFEGFFDTDTDAAPIESINNWFEENVNMFGYNKFSDIVTLSSKGDKIIINPIKENIKRHTSNIIYFNDIIPDYIHFDKNNWSKYRFVGCVQNFERLSNQNKINQIPYIRFITTDLEKFEVNTLGSAVSVLGNRQTLKKYILNIEKCTEPDFTIELTNFAINDITNIEINKCCNINCLCVDFKNITPTGNFRKLLNVLSQKYSELNDNVINVTTLLNDNYNDFVKWLIKNDIYDLNFYQNDKMFLTIRKKDNNTIKCIFIQ